MGSSTPSTTSGSDAGRAPNLVVRIQSPDQPGLIARLSSFFWERGFNVLHCEQHTDRRAGRFFMRLKLDLSGLSSSRRELEEELRKFVEPLEAQVAVHYSDRRQRVALLVTKASHCLYDLMLRQKEGDLDCDIPLILSNHPHLEEVAEQFRIPYFCLPVSRETKAQQEEEVRRLLRQHHIDLVVLARYMQVLTADFVDAWAGRIINIHHAFLPAFQGARPYRQAYERGVKMIGATAHYVTADLDEGPIIEQDVERVSHEHSPRQLSRIGRDIERRVLSRAVKAHLEHRVLLDGARTVVFSGDA
ncbi:MAG: formyltetrahydrofolate deformylase [Acidobacteriota bacterium]